MKKLLFATFLFAIFAIQNTFTQIQELKDPDEIKYSEKKVGHIFYLSVPDDMLATNQLNTSASAQYFSQAKDMFTIVIDDSKVNLKMLGFNFANLKEFTDDFLNTFEKPFEIKSKSEIKKSYNLGGNNSLVCEIIAKMKDGTEVYYYITVIESRDYYYKVISWTKAKNKNKMKRDFEKIAQSLRE